MFFCVLFFGDEVMWGEVQYQQQYQFYGDEVYMWCVVQKLVVQVVFGQWQGDQMYQCWILDFGFDLQELDQYCVQYCVLVIV